MCSDIIFCFKLFGTLRKKMNIFLILLMKIFPLYLNVLLGFLASKFLDVQRHSVASILIYIIGPIVVLSATMSVEINMSIAFLPIFLYLFGSILAFLTLFIFKKNWNDATGNILAFSSGTGNTGYFGIPLALIFFEPELANIYIFTVLASLLYENTTGFYVTAKGNFTAKQSLFKVIKLPILHSFIIGITLNLAGFKLPEEFIFYTDQFKSAYGILGMMMLGMGLHGFNKSEDLDLKFITISFFLKFILWPVSILTLIYLDKTVLNLLNEDLYKVLVLFSIVPLAGNTVSLAVLLNAKPEKASLSVFLSTILSILFIPLVMYLYGGF